MKKKILWKDAWQAITGSLGRFVAIFMLMMVAVFTFIGLKMTGPDMRSTAVDSFKNNNLADITVVSNYGLNSKDKQKIENQSGVKKIEYSYLQDSTVNDSKKSLRVYSESKKISKVELTKGHMPKNNSEIVISYLLKDKYKLGKKITLDNHSSLKHKKFKVVGYVRSSEYLDKHDMGQTTVGTGQLSGFAFVKKSTFKSGTTTGMARITYKKTAKMNPYSIKYSNYINDKEKDLKKELDKNISAKENKTKNKIAEINDSLTKLNAIVAVKPEYQSQIKQLESAKAKLEYLNKPSYTVNTRDEFPGYENYRSNAERIDVLSNIFPVFLFAISALVSLTTMTRFVEEERINIGTMKAIGYSNFDVAKKFIVYSMLSSTLGVILGAFGGFRILPGIIFEAYAANSTMTGFRSQFSLAWLILGLVVAWACTTLAALYALKKDVKDRPAQLLLPKPPKKGSKIFLERITPFWSRLSFNHKVTFRNLFRYKTRMLMTIFGVAGCTGLLVMAFGIRDSLSGISKNQYTNIIKYDMIAVRNSNSSSKQNTDLLDELDSNSVKRYKQIHFTTLNRNLGEDKTKQTINVIVPKANTDLSKYINLMSSSTGKKLKLTNNGVIISEKLAQLTNAKVGHYIKLKDTNDKWKKFKVSGICEMYMGHYMVMNKQAYKHYFDKEYKTNGYLITTKSGKLQTVSEKLMATGAIKGINQNVNNKKTIDNLINSLNKVILILIAISTILALVVIYNLTNINVDERMRELSTIKVLGFFDKEVTMYIYRETIILSILGILAGYLVGIWLHSFIITTLPPVNAMFDPNMYISNFIYSALIPVVITTVLAFIMHKKIKDVDMLDALKSVE